jgi:hypothetical protein
MFVLQMLIVVSQDFPSSYATWRLTSVSTTAHANIPPQDFEHPSCWYYRWQKIERYGFVVAFICMTSVPNLVIIRSAVLKLYAYRQIDKANWRDAVQGCCDCAWKGRTVFSGLRIRDTANSTVIYFVSSKRLYWGIAITIFPSIHGMKGCQLAGNFI